MTRFPRRYLPLMRTRRPTQQEGPFPNCYSGLHSRRPDRQGSLVVLFGIRAAVPLTGQNSRLHAVCASPTNSALGKQLFTQDNQQYFTTARVDFTQPRRSDFSVRGYINTRAKPETAYPSRIRSTVLANTTINSPLTQYSHGLGFRPRTQLTTSAPISA